MSSFIGIDYGLARIGIAVSDPTGTIASAVGTHHEGVDGSVFARLAELAVARGAVGVIVGWPLTTNGQEGAMARRVRAFATKLESALQLPVTLVDERFSSREAELLLRASGRRWPKGEIDALAAALILQQHLDRLAARADQENT
jgi:putative Holliday junction resolvase